MTEFLDAQLAKPAPKNKPLGDPFWDEYLLEPKHDGMRAIVVIDDNGEVSVQSRTNKPYAAHVPDLVADFNRLPAGTILDGELAVVSSFVEVDYEYVPVVDFNATMRIMGSGWEKAVSRQGVADSQHPDLRIMDFILFDVLKYNGEDLTGKTQSDRREYIELVKQAYGRGAPIMTNPQYTNPEKFQEIYDSLVAQGIEGAILKRKEATYIPGKRQNKAWYKFKTTGTADVVVTGFTEAKEGVGGKYLGQVGAVQFGAYDEGLQLIQVGQTSGFNDALRQWFTEVRDSWQQETTPLPLDDNGEVMVMEIKYNDLVGTGTHKTPRHPQFVTLRNDKEPADCLMEQFKA